MWHRGAEIEAFDPTIAAGAGQPVSLTGSDDRVRLVSDDYCRTLMRSREELINIAWPALVHPDDVAEPSAKQAILFATGEPYDVCCRVLRSDGRWLSIRYRASLAERRCGAPLIQSSAWIEPFAEIVEENRRAAAEYIQSLSAELARMADRQQLPMLQHLLSMVSLEAAQELQRQFPGLIAGTNARVH